MIRDTEIDFTARNENTGYTERLTFIDTGAGIQLSIKGERYALNFSDTQVLSNFVLRSLCGDGVVRTLVVNEHEVFEHLNGMSQEDVWSFTEKVLVGVVKAGAKAKAAVERKGVKKSVQERRDYWEKKRKEA